MLRIIVPGQELFDEVTQKFSNTDEFTLELEHSLVSLSKWEAKYQVPFLGPTPKTNEDIFGYIESMIVTPNFPSDIITRLSQDNLEAINKYIESKESATTFGQMPKNPGRSEIITSELIYYWMVTFNIPFECENWHLNRLFSLIKICNLKNSKPTKMNRKQLAERNRALNAQRKAQLGTTG